jgi:hypothetical protein
VAVNVEAPAIRTDAVDYIQTGSLKPAIRS